jgi:hypothetical protein
LQQDSNLTPLALARNNKLQKITSSSSKSIKTPIAENYHPKEKTIHKDPPPRLVHE